MIYNYIFKLTHDFIDPQIYVKKPFVKNYTYIGSYYEVAKFIYNLTKSSKSFTVDFKDFSSNDIETIMSNLKYMNVDKIEIVDQNITQRKLILSK